MRLVKAAVMAAMCGWGAVAAAADDAMDDAQIDALLKPAAAPGAGASATKLTGAAEFGAAYTLPDPGHWSKLRARVELGAGGRLNDTVKWKLSARADADAAYDLERNHYPGDVRRNQRNDASIREAYVDVGAGDLEFRLGRQQIVWGEMVGFFFADVVSARDMREFLLPELESMRIAQWAARAEYYAGETHLEALWIPVASYDRIGKPGSDFYPYPLPAGTRVRERTPDRNGENGNWGLRASRLIGGWDFSAFYYSSLDISPTLSFNLETNGLELRHDRIRQVGGTFSKDLGSFVLKGEVVHTRGRGTNTLDPLGRLGVVKTDMLDYAIGVDIPVEDVWRFNVQYFARVLDDHHPDMQVDREERGATFQVVRDLGNQMEAEFLAASSLNRHDLMLRPKLTWKFAPAWRGIVGLDIFEGRPTGMFGRFDDRDRVYVEVRRWF
ncbi:DUF1302 family protein [Thauera sinica]|uniref:DUF1302 family protein n=1 Tax=Thauera sinica TaxID=2665146 RepID=A0ABW1AZ38_9RHOO|nr:DUF1302 family protein [Thauera sp. K11]ATE60949.1 hypothetical protein CCZ27_14260 [Thauera sp. K11]